MKKQCRGNEQALKKGGRGSQHTSMVQGSGYFDGLLLKQYAKKKKVAEQSLFAWYEEVCSANWKHHNELKEQFRAASIISDKRVVFNIHGNTYRLIVDIEYRLQLIFIVWIGMHKEYDKIDVKKVVYVKTN